MASIRDFGIPGVSETIAHPKRGNLYRVLFQGIAGGGDARDLSAQCISFKAPTVTTSRATLHRYNSKSFIATTHEWSNTQMTIEDDIGGRASNILTLQHEIQQRLIGAGPGPFLATARAGEDYKFAIKLDQMDGDQGVLETWVLEGCWIEGLDFGTRAYEQGDPVKIEVTLSIDHAYHQVFGPDGSAIGGVGSL